MAARTSPLRKPASIAFGTAVVVLFGIAVALSADAVWVAALLGTIAAFGVVAVATACISAYW